MKQERYLNDDGTDTIDKWAATRSNEAFRDIMFAQVEKYHDRLGKKDSIVSEVGKMADYMNRWLEYEKEWAEPKKVQEGERYKIDLGPPKNALWPSPRHS